MKYACSEGDKMQRVLAVCITLLLVSCSEPLFVVEGKIDTYEWINPKNIGVSFVAQEDLDSNFASSLPYVSASPNNSFHVEIPSNYAYLSKIYLIYDQFELSYDIDVAVDSYLSKGITLLDIGTFPFFSIAKTGRVSSKNQRGGWESTKVLKGCSVLLPDSLFRFDYN